MKKWIIFLSVLGVLAAMLVFFKPSMCCGEVYIDDRVYSDLKLQAEKGNIKSMWAVVYFASERNNIDDEFEFLDKIIKATNDDKAMYQYFCLSLTYGDDTEKKNGSIYLYTAAEKQNHMAQFSLAESYEEGKNGYQKDASMAVKWYQLAGKGKLEKAAKIRICKLVGEHC